MRFFGLKACDTCRKALKALAAAGHSPQVIDVRADGVSDADRAAIIAQFGDAAINRASTTWRGLTDAEKDAAPADLLAAHPTLMKRPVIEVDGGWTIGWKADVQAKYLGD
ncbi:Arsenate reductase, glutaredoxin family [Yoonia rosea]|uniref:Arsenate reductase, glutaredoxin family n=1 Tax=Yoonia rosea TaxID=287098 RepID=A0A1R3WVL0_9RHOB|nr:ArsC/Spx/MgsR family protein [Yoonia rosea]SIT82078.1 Arsenate reductase, glutaredoxin family [Yoonia rosea]